VEIQDYLTPDAPWMALGKTPIDKIRLPNGYFRWRVSKAGVGTYEVGDEPGPKIAFPLDAVARASEGMVAVNGGRWTDMVGFLGWVGPYTLPAYDIDRFEVTNRQFQEFVDKGGYDDPQYWKEPIIRDGRTLAWKDAIALLRDPTGRPGPSTWRAGHYPDGRADYPVSGVSWYEAAAYAAFAGKSLPALAQWYRAAPPDAGRYLAQVSNLSASAIAPVGQFKGVGPYGTYDMAGNVREWCANAVAGNDYRFILGGAWTSPSYLYGEPESLPPLDRTDGNGIRLVKNYGPMPADALARRQLLTRDPAHFTPASDVVFRAYRALYVYDKLPLRPSLEGADETADWRREKVSFDAAYGNERVPAFVFLPKRVPPPYQAIVFFPSARVEFMPSSARLGDMEFLDYVIQSGRAVIYPIYQATYERLSQTDRERGATFPHASRGREVLIQQTKDVERAVDYLQSRPDIDAGRIGYLGVSMGSAYGAIINAVEQRFKALVWLDGGLFLDTPAAGVDQVDFAPRIKAPLLMVNGRYDFVFPLEAAQLPLFRLVGTPEADKRHVVLNTPHDVSAARPQLMKEVLAWLDKYLGIVR
jgi:dienelactone hydrolase